MIADRRRRQQQQEEEGAGAPSRAEPAGIDGAPFRRGAQFLSDRRVVDFFRILRGSTELSAIPYAAPVVDPRRRAGRTPPAHDSDPHTAVPVCRGYGPRYSNRFRRRIERKSSRAR